jgi:hypothetical protein
LVVSQHPPGHAHVAPLELPLDDELGPSPPDPLPLPPATTPLLLMLGDASKLTISTTLPPQPRAAQTTTAMARIERVYTGRQATPTRPASGSPEGRAIGFGMSAIRSASSHT